MSQSHLNEYDPNIEILGQILIDKAPPSRFNKIMLNAGDKLKSFEGIDEVIQLSGQILPGILGPSLATAALAIATPLVFLGFYGMRVEYKTACKEYEEIKQSQKECHEKLHAIAENAEKWRHVLAQKLNLGIAPAPDNHQPVGKLKLNAEELEKFIYHFIDSENFRNKAFIGALHQKYGRAGVYALGSMAFGMVPMLTTFSIGLSEEVGTASLAVIEAASKILIASNALFLFGQAAMTIYAGNKIRIGKNIEQILQANKTQFNKHIAADIKPEIKNAINEIFDIYIKCNNAYNTQYGWTTLVGQPLMTAGTVLTLTGVLAPAGITLFATGASITVSAAIWRIIYTRKEVNMKGMKSEYSLQRTSKTELINLIQQHTKTEDIVQALATEFEFISRQLAQIKLYSLLRHQLKDIKCFSIVCIRRTPEERFARLEKIFEKNRASFAKEQGLKGHVINIAAEIFSLNRDNIKNLLHLPPCEAKKVLLANIVKCAMNLCSELPRFDENLDVNSKSPELVDLQNIIGIAKNTILTANPIEDDYTKLNRALIKQIKRSLKFVRNDLADKFVHLAHIKELHIIIANENLLQEPERKQESALLDTSLAETKQYKAKFYHNYNILKQSLTNPDIQQPVQDKTVQIKEQLQTINELRLNGKKANHTFILVKKYPNEKGDTVSLWEHPLYRGQPEHAITYIKDKDTNKTTVTYGSKTSAAIINNVNKDGSSPIVMEISQGQFQTFGASSNHNINLAASGLKMTRNIPQPQQSHAIAHSLSRASNATSIHK